MNHKFEIIIFTICSLLLGACDLSSFTSLSSIQTENSSSNGQNFKHFDLNASPATYSLTESQGTTPKDVLREVDWSGGQGGFTTCAFYKLSKGELKLLQDNPIDEAEWMTDIYTSSCGWKPGESVTATVTSPSGNITAWHMIANEDGEMSGVIITNTFNTQPGKYFIENKGESGTLSQTIIIKTPTEPRLYIEDNSLLLYNFSAFEQVRLLVYIPAKDRKGTLWDSKEYITDGQGQLIIHIDKNNTITSAGFIIIGKTSGEVHVFPSWTDPLHEKVLLSQ
jgi:hypothetical protein